MKPPLLARLRRHAPSRHAAFAAGLRRGAVAARVTPAMRTLRRLRAWTRQVLRTVHVHVDVASPARVAVTQIDVHPVARTVVRAHQASSSIATHHRETLLLRRAVARLHTATRSVVRTERTLREVATPPPQRLPMTLARSPSPSPRADTAPPRRDVEPPTSGRTRPPTPSPASSAVASAFALPAQELSRVTEHVIRQLDQRVLSYRERTGRI